jgi:hypothetical protein
LLVLASTRSLLEIFSRACLALSSAGFAASNSILASASFYVIISLLLFNSISFCSAALVSHSAISVFSVISLIISDTSSFILLTSQF